MFFVALGAAVVLMMGGCGKDDGAEVVHDAMGTFDGSTIVGLWRLDKLMADVTDLHDGSHVLRDDTESTEELTRRFASGGTVVVGLTDDKTLQGTYTYDDSVHLLTVTFFGESDLMTVQTLTATTLVVSAVYRDEDEQEIDTFTYSRQ